jgi:hypothetical protein
MKSNRYALYKINNQNILDFDASKYSLLKFGHRASINDYANKLFSLVLELHNSDAININNSVILIGPYQFIDTASSLLTKQTISLLNQYAKNTNNLMEICHSKVNRKTTYFTDYALMSKEDRYNLIKNDSFIVDYDAIGSKDIIIIDDIRISGTHEDIMYNIFKDGGFQNTINFIFLAEVERNEFDPKIEHFFNSKTISNVKDLIPYITSDSLDFTTRGVKMILSQSQHEFIDFIAKISIDNMEELRKLAIGNEYDKIELISNNLEILKEKLTQKN